MGPRQIRRAGSKTSSVAIRPRRPSRSGASGFVQALALTITCSRRYSLPVVIVSDARCKHKHMLFRAKRGIRSAGLEGLPRYGSGAVPSRFAFGMAGGEGRFLEKPVGETARSDTRSLLIAINRASVPRHAVPSEARNLLRGSSGLLRYGSGAVPLTLRVRDGRSRGRVTSLVFDPERLRATKGVRTGFCGARRWSRLDLILAIFAFLHAVLIANFSLRKHFWPDFLLGSKTNKW